MSNAIENRGIGEVKIAADVVAMIAGLAATEIDGVHSMAGNVTNDLIAMLGKRNLAKGVKVQMERGVVNVDIMINVKYGYSIPEVSKQVQDKVAQQIETMTGLRVADVDVRIASVNLTDM